MLLPSSFIVVVVVGGGVVVAVVKLVGECLVSGIPTSTLSVSISLLSFFTSFPFLSAFYHRLDESLRSTVVVVVVRTQTKKEKKKTHTTTTKEGRL